MMFPFRLHLPLLLLVLSTALACGDAPAADPDPIEDADVGDVDTGDPDAAEPEPPAAPQNLSASDGEDPDAVTITWESDPQVDYYRLSRDGEEIALVVNSGASTLSYRDRDALPTETIQPPTELAVVIGEEGYELTFSASGAESGATHSYTVVAVNEIGESEPSGPDEGYRAGPPIAGYEVEIDGNGLWIAIGDERTFRDVFSDVPEFSVGAVSASNGEFFERVALEAEAPTLESGDAPTYRVRAVTVDNQTSAPSEPRSALLTADNIGVQWERSVADDPDAAFEPLDADCANELVCDDTTGPSDEARYYRLVATLGAGEPVGTEAVRGWRSDCDPNASPFGSGSGAQGDPYTLCTVDHLNSIANNATEHFKLSASIDLSQATEMPGGITGFGGVFDGQGNALIGYTAESGLFFSIAAEGVVQNLVMEDIVLTPSPFQFQSEAGVVADINEGTIISVRVGGVLRLGTEDPMNTPGVGGIAGRNAQGSLISGSHVFLEIESTGTTTSLDPMFTVGNVAGRNAGVIEDSSGHGTTNVRVQFHGGLVGTNSGPVVRSFSTADVNGTTAGSLIGVMFSNNTIEDVYATGDVLGRDVGGLVGTLNNGSTITRAYATGQVRGEDSYVGGLTGRHYNNIVVENAYWDPSTTLQTTSAGGEALSTAEFGDEANFEGWSFAPAADAIWVMGIDEEGNARPKLAWEE